jgi:hypothetical protein
MIEGMVVWIMAMKGREETISTEEVMQDEINNNKKNEEKKAERGRRSDACTKALVVNGATDWEHTTDGFYTEELECYYEEREYDEEQYAHYYQDHIHRG